jgi:DNA-binding NarL/FixJ family response regulator
MKQRRILIADDHPIVRRGLVAYIKGLPKYLVCEEVDDGLAAVASAKKLKPDIAILDHQMGELNGIEATRKIKAACPDTEVMLFTAVEDEVAIRAAFDAGAKSYIHKTELTEHLEAALEALANHRPYFTTRVGEVLFSRFLGDKTLPATHDELSPREREVLKLVAEGKPSKEICDMLSISLKTVETHRASIMRKLKLDSIAALVRYAIRNHIIEA